jgi:hypothetical protein
MPTLYDFVDAELKRWHNPYPLQSLFGSDDPGTVVTTIETFCRNALGSPLHETIFYEVSLGIVVGLSLADGRHVVIKGLIEERPLAYLRAVVRVQRYLLAQGFPCTRPLYDPLPLGRGLALVEALDASGEFHDAHDPRWRRPLAEHLAWLIRLLRHPEKIVGVTPDLFDFRLPADTLWGKPHSNIFDFAATTQGAEWIDEIARKAKSILDNRAGDLVLGHTDWSTKHVRYTGDKVHIIYDWDSLALNKEPAIVGSAAMYYTYIPFLPDASGSPTREETLAFIADYETARGKAFSQEERLTLNAAITYSYAYSARCEHSLSPHDASFPEGSNRALLAHYRDTLLL